MVAAPTSCQVVNCFRQAKLDWNSNLVSLPVGQQIRGKRIRCHGCKTPRRRDGHMSNAGILCGLEAEVYGVGRPRRMLSQQP